MPIKVLTGADEGRLSALGVKIGFFKPKGIVADLGGTSMELRSLGDVSPGETFLLGPLARAKDAELTLEKRVKAMRKILSGSDLATEFSGNKLFAVGGAWIVPDDAIAAGDWARITELARGASQAAAAVGR